MKSKNGRSALQLRLTLAVSYFFLCFWLLGSNIYYAEKTQLSSITKTNSLTPALIL